MSDNSSLHIGFTQVLYGVVVANAIYQLQFELVFRNLMLLLAMAFILGDWIEYQITIKQAPETMTNYVTAFVLDVVILIIWYFMTILSASELEWFFVMAGLFFFLQATWDGLILKESIPVLVRKPHVQLTPVFLALAIIERYLAIPSPALLALAAVIFVARKFPEWKNLLAKSPEAI